MSADGFRVKPFAYHAFNAARFAFDVSALKASASTFETGHQFSDCAADSICLIEESSRSKTAIKRSIGSVSGFIKRYNVLFYYFDLSDVLARKSRL